ncbi:MAG: GNAT family N-acetyltransferase [Rhodospirillaceae bacterium]|nr:GNAT family N-acetyltransferase [Rhodospirillaceae bacterium]
MVRPHPARDLVIRRAAPADAPAIAALARELHAHQGDPTTHFTAEAIVRDGFAPDSPLTLLVAELDGQVAAYAVLAPAYETAWAAKGLYLADIHVTDAAQRRGVGRALMAACAATARRAGTSYLWWCSKAWNVDAQAFYRKLGASDEPVVAHALTFERFEALADEGARLLSTESAVHAP